VVGDVENLGKLARLEAHKDELGGELECRVKRCEPVDAAGDVEATRVRAGGVMCRDCHQCRFDLTDNVEPRCERR
jgi:hypothetical protein